MQRVYQTIHTDLDKDIIGNCLQACIASLFDLRLEDVPFFYRMDYYMPFLKEKFNFEVQMKKSRPPSDDKYYIASFKVIGVTEIHHVVIVRNNRIVHDPKRPRVKLYRLDHYFEFSPCVVVPSVFYSPLRSVRRLKRTV